MKSALAAMSAVYLAVLGLALVLFLEKNPGSAAALAEPKPQSSPQTANMFRRTETEDALEVSYGWKDFQSARRRVGFVIEKAALRESDLEFGYVPEELEAHLQAEHEKLQEAVIVDLATFTRQQIDRSAFPDNFVLEQKDPKSFNIKVVAPPDLKPRVLEEFDRIRKAIAQEQDKAFLVINKDLLDRKRKFLEDRGLRVLGDQIGVNYALCVRRNIGRVKNVFDALSAVQKNASLRQLLELLIAFIQEMRYGVPSLREGQKVILQFWVPLKVLANNYGDCDSKSVAFAAVWLNFKRYPVLLFKIPKHMFIGLAIPSLGDEGPVINGLRYTLCEVAGPDKVPPGLLTPYSRMYLNSGRYTYELVK